MGQSAELHTRGITMGAMRTGVKHYNAGYSKHPVSVGRTD